MRGLGHEGFRSVDWDSEVGRRDDGAGRVRRWCVICTNSVRMVCGVVVLFSLFSNLDEYRLSLLSSHMRSLKYQD